MPFALRSVLAAVCAFAPFAALLPAQKDRPKPSTENQRLTPLIGSWQGSGVMTQPSAKTKWTANGTYRWALGGFWIQEDFTITFEGNPDPLVFRGYLGWDAERKTFVNASVNNGGEAQLHDFTLQPDGTMLQVMLQHGEGAPYAERSLMKVEGDSMTHSIDLLMGKGPSTTMLDGKFERQDAEAPSALDAKGTWMGAVPNESMQKLARMVGSYATKMEFVSKPGQPVVKIQGVDTYRSIFGGTVLHLHTDGAFEGEPGKLEQEIFWAWNGRKNCFVVLCASNLGDVSTMEVRFAADGKALVGTLATTVGGEPAVVRTVVGLDDKGQPKTMLAHLMIGTNPPFEHVTATYTKK